MLHNQSDTLKFLKTLVSVKIELIFGQNKIINSFTIKNNIIFVIHLFLHFANTSLLLRTSVSGIFETEIIY